MKQILKVLRQDRLLHFFFGFMIFVGASIFLTDIWSLGIVASIAILKELYDKFIKKTHFDQIDFAFTILPAVLIIIASTL